MIAAAVLARSLSRKTRSGAVPASAPVLVVGWMAGYGAWAIVFHYYRYFAAGELLAPVAILALLRMLDARRLPHAWLAVAVAVIATAATGSWGRSDWTDGPLSVRVPPVPAKTPAVVLVDGSGISFVSPLLSAGYAVLRCPRRAGRSHGSWRSSSSATRVRCSVCVPTTLRPRRSRGSVSWTTAAARTFGPMGEGASPSVPSRTSFPAVDPRGGSLDIRGMCLHSRRLEETMNQSRWTALP